jgi:hypothetical protein
MRTQLPRSLKTRRKHCLSLSLSLSRNNLLVHQEALPLSPFRNRCNSPTRMPAAQVLSNFPDRGSGGRRAPLRWEALPVLIPCPYPLIPVLIPLSNFPDRGSGGGGLRSAGKHCLSLSPCPYPLIPRIRPPTGRHVASNVLYRFFARLQDVELERFQPGELGSASLRHRDLAGGVPAD